MKTLKKLISYHMGPLSFILMSLFFLISTLVDNDHIVQANIKSTIDTTRSIAFFHNIEISGPGEITISKPSFKMRLLAPEDLLIADPLYCIIIIIVCITLLFKFWNFSFKYPFSRNTFYGIRFIAVAVGVFLVANFWRYQWFNSEIKELTNGLYKYKILTPFNLPEFWILMILYRLDYVFKKGYKLQIEQELTV
ncbi:MAG: hypothetical protein WKF59_00085 [Chitinophagaceae bacterium]